MRWRIAGLVLLNIFGVCFLYWILTKPASWEYEVNTGRQLTEHGQFAEAIPHLIRGIELRPVTAYAHDNLGVCYANTGRSDEALSEFTEAVRLDPDSAMSGYNLALALVNAGRRDEGLEEALRAQKLTGADARLADNIATLVEQCDHQQ